MTILTRAINQDLQNVPLTWILTWILFVNFDILQNLVWLEFLWMYQKKKKDSTKKTLAIL